MVTRIVFFAWVATAALVSSSSVTGNPGLFRPVDLFACRDQLLVVNRDRGSLTRIDPVSMRIVSEQRVSDHLTAGLALDDGRVVVIDGDQHRLTIVGEEDQYGAHDWLSLPASPLSIQKVPHEPTCVVASSWARRLSIVDVSGRVGRLSGQIDLPFSPREMLFHRDGTLWVADAFGGKLAGINLENRQLIRVRQLKETHNITGLAVAHDGETLYVTHQMLSGRESTTAPNVHWGDVMSNVVRRVDLAWFVTDAPEETTANDFYFLGYPDSAAGDPTGLLITTGNRFVVLFSGVDEVAISDVGMNHFQRPAVGRRPTAMWMDESRGQLFVANQFDDSISVVDLQRSREIKRLDLGDTRSPTMAELGEQFFYDARLSSDGWYSCHSCHTDGHTNGRLSDTLGDGYHGAAKLVPSLFGTAETRPWAWNGKMATLEGQIRKSIETTMRGPTPTTEQVQAIAAFLMVLPQPPPLSEARRETETELLDDGQELFAREGCIECHRGSHLTSPDTYDVGLVDSDGGRQFNPPSLLGVGHRTRLLHDGSAHSIREALRIHPYGEPIQLDDNEWQALEAFLRSR